MESYHILYAFFIARYFVPMTIFMTPYLIEQKKFTNKEIFNKITPFFFIASLFASLLGSVLVSKIGNKFTLLIDTGLELICYVIFYLMPERSFAWCIVTGLLHGVVTSFGSLTKGILMENKPPEVDREKMFREHATIKKLCGVFASWMGQDMKYSTGTHHCNLLFSFCTLILSFCICYAIPEASTKEEKKNFLEVLFSGSFLKQIREIYDCDVAFFSLLNIIGSTLYISFAMYSASLFIERKKDIDPSVSAFGRVMYNISKPIRYVTWVIIKTFGFFDTSVQYNPSYNKNTIIFGYIDGLSKLLSILSSLAMSWTFEKNSALHLRCFGSTVLVMFFTYLMGVTTNLMNSYIVFILGSTASQISFIWAYKGLSKNKEVLHIILGLNLVGSSLVHIFISYYTKWRNYSVSKKIMVYFYVNAVLLGLAVTLKAIK